MAGAWLKMPVNLPQTPKFVLLRAKFNLSEGELLALLFKLSAWFEVHGEYGHMLAADARGMNAITSIPRLFEELESCGWLKPAGDLVRLTGFCSPSALRKAIGAKLRAQILSIGSCAACGETENLEVDHIVPIARGGSNDRNNLQCLCNPCNRKKFQMTMTEFMALNEVF